MFGFPSIALILLLFIAANDVLSTTKQPNQPDDGSGNSDDDDGIDLVASTQVTNINANLDVALIDLWPLIANSGRDHTPLPDIEEGITVVFSSVLLTNGQAWHIRQLNRIGDAWLRLDRKMLTFTGSILVGSVNFSYEFSARVLGIQATGLVHGVVSDTIITGVFTVHLNDTNLHLVQMKIVEFGDIALQLKSNALVSWLSEPFLRAIARLFETRLTTTVTDGIAAYVMKLLDDINEHDRLQLKMYARAILPTVPA